MDVIIKCGFICMGDLFIGSDEVVVCLCEVFLIMVVVEMEGVVIV